MAALDGINSNPKRESSDLSLKENEACSLSIIPQSLSKLTRSATTLRRENRLARQTITQADFVSLAEHSVASTNGIPRHNFATSARTTASGRLIKRVETFAKGSKFNDTQVSNDAAVRTASLATSSDS